MTSQTNRAGYSPRVPLYAAYGTNLDPQRMADKCPHSPLQGTGWLEGWRLTFSGEDLGWDGPMATIVPDTFDHVFVAVYDVAEEDIEALDKWEGPVGAWRKMKVRVQLLSDEVLAFAYILDAYEGGLPSASYLGVIAEAAEAGGAPDDYVTFLRTRPCRSNG